LESLFGNIAVKSTASRKINTIADLLALIRTHPSPAGAFTKMAFLSEAEKSIFPAPAFLNDLNVVGAPQLQTAAAFAEQPVTKMHRDGDTGFLG
jgi:hypothetical protein